MQHYTAINAIIRSNMKHIPLILLFLIIAGCGKQYVPMKNYCREEPIMLPVEVKVGIIDESNTVKVIENHVKSWEYIEYLRIKGCSK